LSALAGLCAIALCASFALPPNQGDHGPVRIFFPYLQSKGKCYKTTVGLVGW